MQGLRVKGVRPGMERPRLPVRPTDGGPSVAILAYTSLKACIGRTLCVVS